MPANLSKKSIVKHRTRTPYRSAQSKDAKGGDASGTGANSTTLGDRKGKGRSGFQVGPKHAPDGAYLGRAKKIKADLIEKAKIKKHFYTKVKRDDDESIQNGDAMLDQRDEGKFAPEKRPEEKDVDVLNQMRDRDDGRSRVASIDRKVDLRKGAVKKAGSGDAEVKSKGPERGSKRPPENLTKEERLKLREKKSEKCNSQSGSQRGRERGQPNLGARMDLLLEKIKQG